MGSGGAGQGQGLEGDKLSPTHSMHTAEVDCAIETEFCRQQGFPASATADIPTNGRILREI